MALVLFGAVSSIISLLIVGRGAAISADHQIEERKYLMEIYLPLLSVMGTFYFAEHMANRPPTGKTSIEALVFSLVIIAIWVYIPLVAICFASTYKIALEYTRSFRGYGDAVALAATTFYFTKSSY